MISHHHNIESFLYRLTHKNLGFVINILKALYLNKDISNAQLPQMESHEQVINTGIQSLHIHVMYYNSSQPNKTT